MAHSSDSIDDQICRVLVEAYPNYITAKDIASEVSMNAFKVGTRIQRRLNQRKLCESVMDEEGDVRYKASERLRARYQADKDSNAVRHEDHEAMECHEDLGMRLAGEREAVTSQSVMGSPRQANKTSSVLPLKVRPRSRAPSTMGPTYAAPTHVWPPNVAPTPYYYPPPPSMHSAMVFPAGPLQQPMVYPPHPQMRVETPAPYAASMYPSQPSKKSVLPVKLVRRDQGRREEPPAYAESKKSSISSDNGRFDGSLFPNGLWNHIPYETVMARIRTEDMEKLMARRFIPESNKGLRSVDGLSKSVGAKPEGDGGGHTASPDTVKSLRSMGPPPPGFTRAPPDGRSTEEMADFRRRSMPPRLSQERIPLENASVPSSGSSSSSQ